MNSVQLVGSNCKICGRPIAFLPEGIACARCEAVYHRACLPEGTVCPGCHEDLAEHAAREKASEAATHTALMASGRTQTFILMAALATQLFWTFLVVPFGTIVPALLSYYTFVGRRWARWLLSAYVFANLASTTSALLARKGHVAPWALVPLASLIVSALVALWMLLGSRGVRYYLESHSIPPTA